MYKSLTSKKRIIIYAVVFSSLSGLGLAGIIAANLLGIGLIKTQEVGKVNGEIENKRPLAVALVVKPNAPTLAPLARLPLQSLDDVYQSIGVSRSHVIEWQNRYGFDSLGKSDTGDLFVLGYPIFSKIAWMYIDPVTLDRGETDAFAEECSRTEQSAQVLQQEISLKN